MYNSSNFPATTKRTKIREETYWAKREAAVAQWLRASNIFLAIVLVNIGVARVRVPLVSVGRDLNLQKLNYQYLTTSVAVVLVVRWLTGSVLCSMLCVVNVCPVSPHAVDLN